MATLYFEPNEVGGSLLQSPGIEPGGGGMHVYLGAGRGSDLEIMIERMRALGAEIIIPETAMGDDGQFASFAE
jgi:predicted enzyme related to lactoylglutathione lyase